MNQHRTENERDMEIPNAETQATMAEARGVLVFGSRKAGQEDARQRGDNPAHAQLIKRQDT